MKHLKHFLLAFVLMGFVSVTHAQTKETTTTKKSTKAKKLKDSHSHATKYQCPMKCEGDKTYSKAGKCPVCNMNLKEVKATTVAYQCPMGCEGDKTYEKEGKCPVCNMKLKKVEAKKAAKGHEGHSHG